MSSRPISNPNICRRPHMFTLRLVPANKQSRAELDDSNYGHRRWHGIPDAVAQTKPDGGSQYSITPTVEEPSRLPFMPTARWLVDTSLMATDTYRVVLVTS